MIVKKEVVSSPGDEVVGVLCEFLKERLEEGLGVGSVCMWVANPECSRSGPLAGLEWVVSMTPIRPTPPRNRREHTFKCSINLFEDRARLFVGPYMNVACFEYVDPDFPENLIRRCVG